MSQRPNEIPMKEWRQRESARLFICKTAVAHRIKDGKYPGLKIRRVNKRVVYVEVAP